MGRHHVNHEIGLIAAPCDAGANRSGASLGPQALRTAGLVNTLERGGMRVHDLGDLAVADIETSPATPGYHHLPLIEHWAHAVHDAVLGELARQRLPVLLGGDHSLAIGSLSAVARHCRATGQALRVLWLDAHADCNTLATSPSGNLHGMPLACLLGRGPETLTTLAGPAPALDPGALRLFGVRSIDPDEQRMVRELALEVFDMHRIRAAGLRQSMAQALAGLDERSHLHVSFDVDALDPFVAPGVSVPEPDGLSRDEMHQCMAMIAATGRLGSLDVMEFNPLREYRHTASAVLDLLATLLRPSS